MSFQPFVSFEEGRKRRERGERERKKEDELELVAFLPFLPRFFSPQIPRIQDRRARREVFFPRVCLFAYLRRAGEFLPERNLKERDLKAHSALFGFLFLFSAQLEPEAVLRE